MAAASITRSTVKTWQDMGFLPVPLKVSLGMGGGVFNRYPAWAVPRARFVAEKRSAGFTYDEIRVMLAKADAEASRRPQDSEARGRGRARQASEGQGGQSNSERRRAVATPRAVAYHRTPSCPVAAAARSIRPSPPWTT
jgi:DNA-binding transcriptional MerR regulator